MQVVLLAAGLGSRLGALTKDIPKALINVAGKPLMFHALEFAARLRPAQILVVGGYGFPLVARALDQGRAANPALAGGIGGYRARTVIIPPYPVQQG